VARNQKSLSSPVYDYDSGSFTGQNKIRLTQGSFFPRTTACVLGHAQTCTATRQKNESQHRSLTRKAEVMQYDTCVPQQAHRSHVCSVPLRSPSHSPRSCCLFRSPISPPRLGVLAHSQARNPL